MRLVAEFKKFLEEVVNLDNSRIEILLGRVEAIENFLSKSDWKPPIIRFSPQGSWAHKTIIRPPGDQGFDADLLVFIRPVQGWSPSDDILNLKAAFTGSGLYKERAHLHTRCVRLEFAGDFDIDVVPCIIDRPGGTYRFEVCNRTDNEYEPTDGEAFTAWLAQRNTWTGNEGLREAIRLLKYLRDVKSTFTCKSILLSTLVGIQVAAADQNDQAALFPDLATTLRTLVGRMDGYLQARPQLHDIRNPVLPAETFNRHWDQDKYTNFRDMIHRYRGWIDEAYQEPDRLKSVAKWQKVFGDEFGRGGENAYLAEAGNAGPPVPVTGGGDAVALLRAAGRGILQRVNIALPWIQAPPWPVATAGALPVTIRATIHAEKKGPALTALQSGEIVPKSKYLLFEAFGPNGAPFAANRDFDVQWQVVNTDRAAFTARALRGGFYPSDTKGKKWERTEYRGIHWVQAFVIRRRDGRCIGQSNRFFVVIE